MSREEIEGASVPDRALVNEAPAGLRPTGFDPSRNARCTYCQTVSPSNASLPFFEFRGEGSRQATEACKACRCYEVAHHPRTDGPASGIGKIPSVIGTPHPFEPHGAWEFDSFYCGCRGWE